MIYRKIKVFIFVYIEFVTQELHNAGTVIN